MRLALLLLALLLAPAVALAQGSVLQSGPVTQQHATKWWQNGIVGDAGPVGATTVGSGIGELPIVNSIIPNPACLYDASPATSATGYHALCMGGGLGNAPEITYNAFGGATPQGLNFNINNQTYAFPGNGQGNALGPNSSCVGCLTYFNNTAGTLLASHNFLGMTQSATGAQPNAENYIILNENAQAPSSLFFQALGIQHEFGGSAMTGGRNSIEVDSALTAPTSVSNTNRNYVAIFGQMTAVSNDGGTGLSFGSSLGAIFGGNLFANLQNGATNMLNESAEEFDVAAQAGSSVYIKTGIQVGLHVFDAGVHGTLLDAAIAIGNGSTAAGAGWRTAIAISNNFGTQPLTTDACIICTTPGAAQTIATGFDVGSYTITGNFLKSNGFSVTGSGAVSGATYINVGANASLLPSGANMSYWSNNLTGGQGEVDFVNAQNNAAGFNFYQKTGASTSTLVAALTGTGALAIALGMTAPGGYAMTLTTETPSTAACVAGQIAWDASWIYVCTATNNWKHVALSSY